MDSVRKDWAQQVGHSSSLAVQLCLEVWEPGSVDSPCRLQGRVGVPDQATNEAELFYLARILLQQTILPILRPNLEYRITEATTIRLDTTKETIHIDPGSLSMPRFMWWEKEYAEHPYMRSLPMKELNHRFLDIITNSHQISEGGKLGIQLPGKGIERMRYFQHILVEARMRELPFPLFLDNRYSPDWENDSFTTSVKGEHSSTAYQALTMQTGERPKHSYIVKYGEHQFMQRFLSYGEMLISPSKSFDDETYNQAIRDDENIVEVFGAPTTDGRVVPANNIARTWGDRYSMRTFSSRLDHDYFLYCMAGTLSPTLFSHFGQNYDACVVVRDLESFRKRVQEGTLELFPPDEFEFSADWVTYLDPLGAIPLPSATDHEEPTIPFLKHFRHAYQDEYRFVWMPQNEVSNTNKACVAIGSLTDIAELVRLR